MGWIVYCPSDRDKIDHTLIANTGIDAALARIEEFREDGWNIRFVDTGTLTDEERQQLYVKEAATTASFTQHTVHGVFGTDRYPDRHFGIAVPALRIEPLLEADAGDIYPHRDKGEYITILGFLAKADHVRNWHVGVGLVFSDVPNNLKDIMRDNSRELEWLLTAITRKAHS